MAGNVNCKSDNHNKHMCVLKASGYDRENEAEFKKLKDNPQYQCENCGDLANDMDYLCTPVKL